MNRITFYNVIKGRLLIVKSNQNCRRFSRINGTGICKRNDSRQQYWGTLERNEHENSLFSHSKNSIDSSSTSLFCDFENVKVDNFPSNSNIIVCRCDRSSKVVKCCCSVQTSLNNVTPTKLNTIDENTNTENIRINKTLIIKLCTGKRTMSDQSSSKTQEKMVSLIDNKTSTLSSKSSSPPAKSKTHPNKENIDTYDQISCDGPSNEKSTNEDKATNCYYPNEDDVKEVRAVCCDCSTNTLNINEVVYKCCTRSFKEKSISKDKSVCCKCPPNTESVKEVRCRCCGCSADTKSGNEDLCICCDSPPNERNGSEDKSTYCKCPPNQTNLNQVKFLRCPLMLKGINADKSSFSSPNTYSKCSSNKKMFNEDKSTSCNVTTNDVSVNEVFDTFSNSAPDVENVKESKSTCCKCFPNKRNVIEDKLTCWKCQPNKSSLNGEISTFRKNSPNKTSFKEPPPVVCVRPDQYQQLQFLKCNNVAQPDMNIKQKVAQDILKDTNNNNSKKTFHNNIYTNSHSITDLESVSFTVSDFSLKGTSTYTISDERLLECENDAEDKIEGVDSKGSPVDSLYCGANNIAEDPRYRNNEEEREELELVWATPYRSNAYTSLTQPNQYSKQTLPKTTAESYLQVDNLKKKRKRHNISFYIEHKDEESNDISCSCSMTTNHTEDVGVGDSGVYNIEQKFNSRMQDRHARAHCTFESRDISREKSLDRPKTSCSLLLSCESASKDDHTKRKSIIRTRNMKLPRVKCARSSFKSRESSLVLSCETMSKDDMT